MIHKFIQLSRIMPISDGIKDKYVAAARKSTINQDFGWKLPILIFISLSSIERIKSEKFTASQLRQPSVAPRLLVEKRKESQDTLWKFE